MQVGRRIQRQLTLITRILPHHQNYSARNKIRSEQILKRPRQEPLLENRVSGCTVMFRIIFYRSLKRPRSQSVHLLLLASVHGRLEALMISNGTTLLITLMRSTVTVHMTPRQNLHRPRTHFSTQLWRGRESILLLQRLSSPLCHRRLEQQKLTLLPQRQTHRSLHLQCPRTAVEIRKLPRSSLTWDRVRLVHPYFSHSLTIWRKCPELR